MKTIIQHSLNTEVAQKISSDFKVLTTHIRHRTSVDLEKLRNQHSTDFNYLPDINFSKIKLFVSDMDSTLINIECIDEIADFANIKPQVASITERAMQGELDFKASLIERVALLKGLKVDVLNKVYNERLQVNKGGRELIKFLKNKLIKTSVVSGGFTFFTNRLAKDLGLDHSRGCVLNIEDNQLTGTTQGDIIDADAKAEFVKELCAQHAIKPNQVIVVGDGANDLKMMEIAGLSVAFHAKPAVLKQANIVISFGGLDKIIDLFDE